MNPIIVKIIDETTRDLCSVECRTKSRTREIVLSALHQYGEAMIGELPEEKKEKEYPDEWDGGYSVALQEAKERLTKFNQ